MRSLPTIGELRERVELQRRTDVPDVGGGTVQTYTTFATVWANVEIVSGGLYFASRQTEHTVTHAVSMRRRADAITAEYLLWRGRQLRIERLRDLDQTRRFQEFLCEEIIDTEAELELLANIAAGEITDLGDVANGVAAPYDMGDLADGASLAGDLGELE